MTMSHPENRLVTAEPARLLRRREVEKLTGLSRSTIYKLMTFGDFPRPIRIGDRAVAWRSDVLAAWIETRRRA